MKKAILSLLFSVVLIGNLAACGKEEKTDVYQLDGIPIGSTAAGEVSAGGTKTTESREWQDSHLSLGYCLEGAVVQGESIYGYLANGDGISVLVQDTKTGDLLRNVKIPGASEIQSIAADGQGIVYLVGKQGDKDIFWKIDEAGQVSVLGDFVLEDAENAIDIRPRGLFVGEEGYIYLWYVMALPVGEVFEDDPYKDEKNVYADAARIYVKDSGLQTVYYEQVPESGGNRLLSFSADETGTPVLLAETPEGIYLQEVKAQRDGTPERIWMEEADLGAVEGNLFAAEDGFLFCSGSGLYKYTSGSKTNEKMLDLASYGIFSDKILYLGMKNGAVEIVDSYKGMSEYTLLKEGKNSKEQLSLGVIQVSQGLERAVTEFNRFSEELHIEIVDYYDEAEGFDKGFERMKLDIVRKKAPDILEVSMTDYEKLAEKGILADLYEFMEQDSEYRKEMMMPVVREAYEVNGHLYTAAPAFQLYSMWGNASVIGNHYGVTLSELTQILEKSGKGLSAVAGFSADEPILTTLCTMGMDEFIDWENGTCDFEGEAFAEVLEFAKKYAGTNYTGSLSAGIQDGEIVMSAGLISSVADYQVQSALYNGNISFIGYPAVGGSGTAIGLCGGQLAVNAAGKDMDRAWQFVKYYLLHGYEFGFPVLKEQFEEVMAQAMEKSYETFEGETYEVARGSYMDQDTQIMVYEASKSDVDAVRQLIDRAENKFKYRTEIQNIIQEEAESYLSGQKELQEVTALIQNRVGLYLDEEN